MHRRGGHGSSFDREWPTEERAPRGRQYLVHFLPNRSTSSRGRLGQSREGNPGNANTGWNQERGPKCNHHTIIIATTKTAPAGFHTTPVVFSLCDASSRVTCLSLSPGLWHAHVTCFDGIPPTAAGDATTPTTACGWSSIRQHAPECILTSPCFHEQSNESTNTKWDSWHRSSRDEGQQETTKAKEGKGSQPRKQQPRRGVETARRQDRGAATWFHERRARTTE
mmetsp:Transcript_10892/g.25261  ORF Transcript_10892/g.25261 Transcript_10892/m.25261 type:complete len:224 (-) Transcript_10892:125-796(-)